MSMNPIDMIHGPLPQGLPECYIHGSITVSGTWPPPDAVAEALADDDEDLYPAGATNLTTTERP